MGEKCVWEEMGTVIKKIDVFNSEFCAFNSMINEKNFLPFSKLNFSNLLFVYGVGV